MDEDVREETVTLVIPESELAKAYKDLLAAQNIDKLRLYSDVEHVDMPEAIRFECAMNDLLDAATSEIGGDVGAVKQFMISAEKIGLRASR